MNLYKDSIIGAYTLFRDSIQIALNLRPQLRFWIVPNYVFDKSRITLSDSPELRDGVIRDYPKA